MAEESTTRRRLITIAALIGLIAVQTLVAIIYKLAQKNGKYQFSTASALTMAEFIKIWLSFGLHVKATGGLQQAKTELFASLKTAPYIQLILLALSYFINNHINFYLFLWADPVSITVMKSGSSFITAILSWVVLAKLVSKVQWSAILLQVAGLCLLQYDPCSHSTTLKLSGYFVMFISVTIASANGIWNERLLKSYDCSLNIQNMILYTAGTVFNFILFLINSREMGFFQGYDFPAVVIVFLNAVIGLTITVIYKYTNAIAKTFCSAVATVVLFIVNATLFNLPASLNSVLSCIVVFVATYLYTQGAIAAAPSPPTKSESRNGKDYDKLPLSEMDVEEDEVIKKSMWKKILGQITARRIGGLLFGLVVLIAIIVSIQSITAGVPEKIEDPEDVPHVDYPIEPHTVKDAQLRIETLTGVILPPSHSFYDDILVVLHFNSPRYNHLPILLEQYGKVFKNFIVCGPQPHPAVDYVCGAAGGGFTMYNCIADLMEAYPNYAGYLSFHFDLLVNYWSFGEFDKSKTWITQTAMDNEGPFKISTLQNDTTGPTEWWWWGSQWGIKACRKTLKELPQQYKDKLEASYGANDYVWRGMGDLFYVPQRLRTEFIALSKLFARNDVFLEIAVPTISNILQAPTVPSNLTGYFDWWDKPFEEFWKPEYQFAHPFKFNEDGMYPKFRKLMKYGYKKA